MSHAAPTKLSSQAQLGLGLGALGVVFGDIGTSPLYTIRECLHALPPAEHAVAVLGVLSLIVWSLIVVVSVKYTIFVLRADNRGEGGIFALLSLGRLDRGTRNRPELAVTRRTRCPAVLVECAYLSNRADAARSASPEWQEKLAQGIADGVEEWLKQNPR